MNYELKNYELKNYEFRPKSSMLVREVLLFLYQTT